MTKQLNAEQSVRLYTLIDELGHWTTVMDVASKEFGIPVTKGMVIKRADKAGAKLLRGKLTRPQNNKLLEILQQDGDVDRAIAEMFRQTGLELTHAAVLASLKRANVKLKTGSPISKMKNLHKKELVAWLQEVPNATWAKAMMWEKYKIKLSINTISRYAEEIGADLSTGRDYQRRQLMAEEEASIVKWLREDPDPEKAVARLFTEYRIARLVPAIVRLAKKAGVPVTIAKGKRGERKFTDEQNDEIVEMLRAEQSVARVVDHIWEKFGIKISYAAIREKAVTAKIELTGATNRRPRGHRLKPTSDLTPL